MIGLKRAFHRHTDVVGLLLAELGELHAKLVEMQRRHLLVEVLGQNVYVVLVFVVLPAPFPAIAMDQ